MYIFSVHAKSAAASPARGNRGVPFCCVYRSVSQADGVTMAVSSSPSEVTRSCIRARASVTRLRSGYAVDITKALPMTCTSNSRIRSHMPLAVPPPFRKSSTMRHREPLFTARRLRLMVWMLPEEPDT